MQDNISTDKNIAEKIRRVENSLLIASELYPTSEAEFFAKDINAKLVFIKFSQEQATEFSLYQNDRNLLGKRIT